MTEPEESEESGVTPAMYEHCCNVYKRMAEEATTNYDGAVSPVPEVVYEGHFTRLFQDLQLSPPYYTKVRELLVRMGCIEQIRRGGGNAKSKWRLIREPTEEAFSAADAIARPPQGRTAQLEQGLRSHERRLARIEQVLGISQ